MGDRVVTTLACTECKNRNYGFSHGKKRQYKVEVKKFCRACGKQTPHKEVK
jgi:large subunit ribosomal protein L33